MFKASSRVEGVAPFIVMDVLKAAQARAAAGLPVYHLEVGQPGTGAPSAALNRLSQSMASDTMGYTQSFGLPALRARLAMDYQDRYGVSLDPSQIAITAGSSAGFSLAFLSAFEAGDKVALASPGYPAYRNILSALGLDVVELPVGAEQRYQPTIEILEHHPGLKGLIVASPSNPTGTMLSPDDLAALATYCHERGVRLISDEIYHGLSYGVAEASALNASQSAIVVNSFSKFHSMTGWRVGWLVLPEDLVPAVDRLMANMFICAPHVSQIAALGALDSKDELVALKQQYKVNRDMVLAGLEAAGMTDMAPPDGAFYVYARLPDIGLGSSEFCKQLLEQTGVAITPGVDFDPARGQGYVRFSFCGLASEIETGMALFQDFVRQVSSS